MEAVSNTRSAHSPGDHWAALLASFLGWTLDAFDFFLVVVCLTAIGKEFRVSDKAVALSLTLTLAFRPVGAFFFGLLADRYGRRLPLMIDLIFYSIVEVATGVRAQLHYFHGAACAVRNRHGRGVGRRSLARYGEGSAEMARCFVGLPAAGICVGQSAGDPLSTLPFQALGLASAVSPGRIAGAAGAVRALSR